MGYDTVSPLSLRVFAWLVTASSVLFTVYMTLPGLVRRAVLDMCDVRTPLASMASTCWTFVSNKYTDAALPAISALSAAVTQLGYDVLDVMPPPLLQLVNRLTTSVEPYVSSITAHLCAFGFGIATGLRRIASDYLGTRLVDYSGIFAGFRADTLSAMFSVSFVLKTLAICILCFTLYSLWLFYLLRGSWITYDLRFITALNTQVTRILHRLEILTKQSLSRLPNAFATICAIVILWPGQLLHPWRHTIPSSRRATFFEDNLGELRCHRSSFAEIEGRLARLVFVYTTRSVSLTLISLVALGFAAYTITIFYTIWAAYLIRKKPVPSQFLATIPKLTFLARPSSILGSTIASHFPDNYYLLQDFVDRYELGPKLGAGVFGVVCQARRRKDGREVAVKFVKKDASSEYWEEHPIYGKVPQDVIVMDLVRHENIVSLLDVFSDEQYVYIVQEIHGSMWYPTSERDQAKFPNGSRCLESYLHTNGPMTLEDAKHVFYQLVDAVYSLHSNGVTHCDIKPDNILIDSNLKVKLIDFGNVLRKPLLKDGNYLEYQYQYSDPRYWKGHVMYAPPEIFQLGSTWQAPPGDVWALGLVLCYLLTGSPPTRTRYGFTRGYLEYDTMDSSQWEALLPMWGVLDACLDLIPQFRPGIETLRRRNEHKWAWRGILEKLPYRTLYL